MLAQEKTESIEFIQGTPEWLAFRKSHITATDAPIIMKKSPWKTRSQLYHDKLSNEPLQAPNERMKRGLELEPIARDLFCMSTGLKMVPQVIVKDWAMASLDGINEKNEILEIKCPGEKDHFIALLCGKVPDHYYPQLQHQMYVCDAQKAFYYSFDGFEGVTIEVKRDDEYISKMIEEEYKFYQCLLNKTPPEPDEDEYIQRDDDLWKKCVERLRIVHESIKDLSQEEEELRKQLIFLSGESNSKGSGLSLCQVKRKGNIQYDKIPELKGMDLDKYRKAPSTNWRITWDT